MLNFDDEALQRFTDACVRSMSEMLDKEYSPNPTYVEGFGDAVMLITEFGATKKEAYHFCNCITAVGVAYNEMEYDDDVVLWKEVQNVLSEFD